MAKSRLSGLTDANDHSSRQVVGPTLNRHVLSVKRPRRALTG